MSVLYAKDGGQYEHNICYAPIFGSRKGAKLPKKTLRSKYSFGADLTVGELRYFLKDTKKHLIPDEVKPHYSITVHPKRKCWIITLDLTRLSANDVIFLLTHYRVPDEEVKTAKEYVRLRKVERLTPDQAYFLAHHKVYNSNHALFSFKFIQLNEATDEDVRNWKEKFSFREKWLAGRINNFKKDKGFKPYSEDPDKGIVWINFAYGVIPNVTKGDIWGGVGYHAPDSPLLYRQYDAQPDRWGGMRQNKEAFQSAINELIAIFKGKVKIEDRRHWR